MVVKKCARRLRGRFRRPDPVFTHARSPISMPSLSSSPCILGAPHSGFSRLIVRISSRASVGTDGLPGWPRRIFQLQNSRKPFRCQAITVSGLMMINALRQSAQTSQIQTQRSRSAVTSFGRLTERCRTPSWWRRAKISSWRAARLRNELITVPRSADNTCQGRNRETNHNPHLSTRTEFTRTTVSFRAVSASHLSTMSFASDQMTCSVFQRNRGLSPSLPDA